jgi:hypothetical protein
VRRHLDVIRRVTGHKPHTCPWRAYYDPLVIEVMRYVWACDPPNLDAVLPENAPGILVEGIAVYRMALQATLSEDAKLRREKAERERAARAAKNNR